MDLLKTIKISAAGMQAQGLRLRVIAENIANADSLPENPGADPYRRKVVTFKNVLDRSNDIRKVQVDKILPAKGDFVMKYNPTHPGADKDGLVKIPNVKSLLEMMDMREAQRSYEANLSVLELTKGMLMRTIDMLRN